MTNPFNKGADPKEVRTRFILEELIKKPQNRATLEKLAENNPYGYQSTSYGRDTTGLVKSGLIGRDSFGDYVILPLGRQWLYVRNKNANSN